MLFFKFYCLYWLNWWHYLWFTLSRRLIRPFFISFWNFLKTEEKYQHKESIPLRWFFFWVTEVVESRYWGPHSRVLVRAPTVWYELISAEFSGSFLMDFVRKLLCCQLGKLTMLIPIGSIMNVSLSSLLWNPGLELYTNIWLALIDTTTEEAHHFLTWPFPQPPAWPFFCWESGRGAHESSLILSPWCHWSCYEVFCSQGLPDPLHKGFNGMVYVSPYRQRSV